MMKRLAVLAAIALCLPGAMCSHNPEPPRIRTVEVAVPTPVYCVTSEQIPAEPALVGDQLTGNAAADIGPVAISAKELRKVVRIARALLQGCVDPGS